MRVRRRGGIQHLDFESNYCDASNALQLPSSFSTFSLKADAHSVTPLCTFRRFLSDGKSVMRIEAGFRHKHRPKGFAGKHCKEILESFLRMPVQIPGSNRSKHSCEFGSCGYAIAEHYLRSTTKRGNQQATSIEKWWVTPGLPLLLLECDTSEVLQVPQTAQHVRAFPDAGFTLFRDNLFYKENIVGVWIVQFADAKNYNHSTYHELRVSLSRLHAERECLKETLRLINLPEISSALDLKSKVFSNYLGHAVDLLLRPTFHGFDRSDTLEVAQQSDDMLRQSERENILSALRNFEVGQQIIEKLEMLTASNREAIRTYIEKVEINNAMGDLIKNVSNSTFVNRSLVQNSFNKVKKTFGEDTAKAIEQVADLVEKSGNSKAGELFAQFNEELQKPTPRKSVLQVTWDGLLGVLPTIGTIAGAAAEIAKLFA